MPQISLRHSKQTYSNHSDNKLITHFCNQFATTLPKNSAFSGIPSVFLISRQPSLSSKGKFLYPRPNSDFSWFTSKDDFLLFLLVLSQTLYFQGLGMQKDLLEDCFSSTRSSFFLALFSYL